MSMRTIKKVELQSHHLKPGQTTHTLTDSSGERPFAAFVSLTIERYDDEAGYYLMHYCADGTAADTWHESMEDALHQAAWEFDVKPSEWKDVDEAFK